MSTTITTTSLNATKFYDLATGAAGFLLWVMNLQHHFMPFFPHGRAFLDGVEHPPTPPHEDDLRSIRGSSRPTPPALTPTGAPHPINRALTADLDDESAITADESAAGGRPAPAPTTTDPSLYLYEHNPNGNGLTKDGYKAFDQDYRAWELELKRYNQINCAFVGWLPTQLKQNALDALEDYPPYNIFLGSPTIAGFRTLLNAVFTKPSTIRSITDFTDLRNTVMLPGETSTAFAARLRAKVITLGSTYESSKYPGFISISAIHLSFLLAGLGKEYKPLIDQLILAENSIHELTPAHAEERVRAYEIDQQAYASAARSNNAFQPNRNKHNKHNPTPQAPSQALLTATPSQWTATHPHTKALGTGAGPGDAKRPHCPHCAKNGYVYNNHGFSGADKGPLCHDLERLRAPPASTSAPPATDQAAMLTAALTALLTAHPDAPIDEAAIDALGSSVGDVFP